MNLRSASFTILGVKKILDRFMDKVSPEALTGCWLWTGSPSDNTKNGQYGRFRVHGVQLRAHRVSWLLHVGDIPDGMHVLHHCDNPACVRPDHLFLGDNDDNVADRVAKGRTGWKHRQGSDHPMRKLTEQCVREIREMAASGARCTDLAAKFGVDKSTISEIVSRKKWGSVC